MGDGVLDVNSQLIVFAEHITIFVGPVLEYVAESPLLAEFNTVARLKGGSFGQNGYSTCFCRGNSYVWAIL